MKEETKEISRLVEDFRRLDLSLPQRTTLDKGLLRAIVPTLERSVPMLRDLRSRIGSENAVETFNPYVADYLKKIRAQGTRTDKWCHYLVLPLTLSGVEMETVPEIREILGSHLEITVQLEQAGVAEELKEVLRLREVPESRSPEFHPFIERLNDLTFDLMSDIQYDAYDSDYFTEEEYVDRCQKTLAKFEPDKIAAREQAVAAAIVGQIVPEVVRTNIARAKRCYLLGLPEATIVFCRSILEHALFDYLGRVKRLPIHHGLAALISSAVQNRYLSSDTGIHAETIKDLANEVIHPLGNKGDVSLDTAKEILLLTRDVIEELYRGY